MTAGVALSARQLVRTFGGGRNLWGRPKDAVYALRGVSLGIQRGETLGLVGESGCGKSTLARLLVGLDQPTAGEIHLGDTDMVSLRRHPKALACRIQYVFQDPLGALNPRYTLGQALATPLTLLRGLGGRALATRRDELLAAVRLAPDLAQRYPHELSGGQAQRGGLARALAAEPEILVLDEPVSALDVSVQAQVLALLEELKGRFDLSYLFISHDLAVVEAVSQRIAVMYFGRIVEEGDATRLLHRPRHPYSRLLFQSIPTLEAPHTTTPSATTVVDQNPNLLPDPLNPPLGCAFAERCPQVQDRCRHETPELEGTPPQRAACFYPLEDSP